MRRRKWLYFIAILLFVFLADSNALTNEYDIKAVLIKKIVKYIEWPARADMNDSRKPFIIKVLGKNPFGRAIEYATANARIKGKNVEVDYIGNTNEIGSCDLLFIAASEKSDLKYILASTTGKAILTIGDTPGYGHKGVHINFYIKNNKIRFELNENAVAEDGFSIDYRLRNIARIINRRKESGQ